MILPSRYFCYWLLDKNNTTFTNGILRKLGRSLVFFLLKRAHKFCQKFIPERHWKYREFWIFNQYSLAKNLMPGILRGGAAIYTSRTQLSNNIGPKKRCRAIGVTRLKNSVAWHQGGVNSKPAMHNLSRDIVRQEQTLLVSKLPLLSLSMHG